MPPLKTIPSLAAKHIAETHRFDQVIIFARTNDKGHKHEAIACYGHTYESNEEIKAIADEIEKLRGWPSEIVISRTINT